MLSIAMTSCTVQSKIAVVESTPNDNKSFRWRVEIKVQPHNINVCSVLAVLGNAPQPVSFKSANDMLQGAEPRIIIAYITATNSEVKQLSESLFEVGAMGLNINKVNQD